MMEKKDFKQQFVAYLMLVFGSALFAVGDVMFVNPYMMAPGGTYGLSNVLNTIWPWKISFYAICMDIPLLLIGTWILGPRFGFKTVLSTILIFVFTFILESVWGYAPVIYDNNVGISDVAMPSAVQFMGRNGVVQYFVPDYILNTIVAGLIYGVAIGVIFRSGATSGGSDIISMILHKYTKISLGTLVLIVDSCITLSTLFIPNGGVRLPIYSIILIYIESKVIDLVVDGTKSYKTAFIVTDKLEEVKDYILNDMHRGGTCITGEGLYNGTERKMIYVTMERADFVRLRANLRRLDPMAFVNVIESSEIMGKGFKALPEEEA